MQRWVQVHERDGGVPSDEIQVEESESWVADACSPEMAALIVREHNAVQAAREALEAVDTYFRLAAKAWSEDEGRVFNEAGKAVVEGTDDIEAACDRAASLADAALALLGEKP